MTVEKGVLMSYIFFFSIWSSSIATFPEFFTSCTALRRLTRHSGALKFTRKFKFKLGTLKSSSQETTKWFDYAHLFKNQISLFVDLTWNQFGIRGFQMLWLVIYLFIGQLFLCFKTGVVCLGECYNAALLCSCRSVPVLSRGWVKPSVKVGNSNPIHFLLNSARP